MRTTNCAVAILFSQILFWISCESVARKVPTKFTPIKVEDGYQYFRFQKQVTNFQNEHLESNEYEKKRIKILEMWLERSEYKNSECEIISRDCIFAGKPLLGGVGSDKLYNIYYEVKVKYKDKKKAG